MVADQRKRPTNQSRNNSNVAPSTTTPQQKKPATNTNTNKSTHTPNSNDTNNVKTATTQAAKSATATAPAPEQHVPLTGFNPAEVEKLLRSGCSPNAERYKPAKPPLQKAGPWGQKPGHTAAGKDFWVELRRQVGQLQKGESASKGG